MAEDMSRRDFLKAASAAVAGGGLATGAEAQEVTRSLAKPEVGMFGPDGQGFPSEYIKRYETWMKGIVENPKVKKEIRLAAQLPVSYGVDSSSSEYQHAEIVFMAKSGLPKDLIIADDSEKVIMHINRGWSRNWGQLADGEVVIVSETYVQMALADKYKAKGLNVEQESGRILKTSFVYNTKTKAFRSF